LRLNANSGTSASCSATTFASPTNKILSTGISSAILRTLNITPNIIKIKYRAAIGTNGGAKESRRNKVFMLFARFAKND
jgi:hypothetical protein